MNKIFKGIYTVVCTPFDKDGEVDEKALRRHIRWLMDEGKVHGIIPCGSTGEFAFLSERERKQVVSITVDEVNKKVPVFAGSAACATKEVIDYARSYKEMGVDGIMVVPSYYGSLNQDELYYHYSTIAQNVGMPVILYNNPSTSGSDILPETVAKLAEEDNIIGIKESTGSMQRVVDIRLLANDKIEVICGCDTLAMEMLLMGVDSWIAAPSNIAPKQCVKLYELVAEQKNYEAGWGFYQKLRPLLDLFEGSGQYVALAKAGLEMMGLGIGEPRKPLLPVSANLRAQLKTLLDSF